MWLSSDKILFTKTCCGQYLIHGPQIADSYAIKCQELVGISVYGNPPVLLVVFLDCMAFFSLKLNLFMYIL